MSNEDAVLQLVNALPELERAAQWLELQIENFGVPPDSRRQAASGFGRSSLEHHQSWVAGNSGGKPNDRVAAASPPRASVELAIVDDGPSFDPTSQTPTHRT